MRCIWPSRRIGELREDGRIGRNPGPSNVVRAAIDIWSSTIELPLSEGLSLESRIILETVLLPN